jgi:hypothetical protein
VLSAVERPHPQLGRDPDVPTWDTRVGHCASDVTLIAVYGGRVDVTIAERVAHQTNISDKNAIGMRSGRSYRIAQWMNELAKPSHADRRQKRQHVCVCVCVCVCARACVCMCARAVLA